MCSTCGCKSAETGKKNCGCGQDPCKTYGADSESYNNLHGWATNMLRDVRELIEDLENGAVYDLDDCRERLEKIRDDTSHLDAETFGADSLKGRWDEGTTRIIHGVSVTKTRYGGEMWEKPQYRCDYNGYSCRIFYEGVAFYLPCWMYRGYGGVGRQGCFKNPMEAILDFKMRAEGGFQKTSLQRDYDAETFEAFDIHQNLLSNGEVKTIIENKCDGCGKEFYFTTNSNIVGGNRAGAIVYENLEGATGHDYPEYSPNGDLLCKSCWKEEAESDWDNFSRMAETKKSFWDDIDSPKKLARMQRNYEKLSNSLYEPTMDYNEIVESKLEKFPSTVDYYGIKFKGGGHAITTTKNKTLAPKLKKDAEYHRDSKGRFTDLF